MAQSWGLDLGELRDAADRAERAGWIAEVGLADCCGLCRRYALSYTDESYDAALEAWVLAEGVGARRSIDTMGDNRELWLAVSGYAEAFTSDTTGLALRFALIGESERRRDIRL